MLIHWRNFQNFFRLVIYSEKMKRASNEYPVSTLSPRKETLLNEQQQFLFWKLYLLNLLHAKVCCENNGVDKILLRGSSDKFQKETLGIFWETLRKNSEVIWQKISLFSQPALFQLLIITENSAYCFRKKKGNTSPHPHGHLLSKHLQNSQRTVRWLTRLYILPSIWKYKNPSLHNQLASQATLTKNHWQPC